MAQLIPLPLTVSCFSKIQIGFKLRQSTEGNLFLLIFHYFYVLCLNVLGGYQSVFDRT